MESISIQGSVRKSLGKADAKSLRREGLVPCIIYGGKENIHLHLEGRAFGKLINTPKVYIVNVEVDGKTIPTIIKDVQFHPVSDEVLHADLQSLESGRPVNLTLPVRTVGTSRGVLSGGKLNLVLRKARVTGVPSQLPDIITIDITKLRIGQAVKVKDMNIPGLTFRENPNQIIVAVKTKRGAVLDDAADEEEATADAPAAEAAAE